MITIISWLASRLVGTSYGRGILACVMVLFLVGATLVAVFLRGKASARMEQAVRDVDSLKRKIEVDNELRTLSPAARRDRLREWVRD